MVEHNKSKDRNRQDREKKIKRVTGNKEEKRFKRDMYDLSTGKISFEDFDEEHGGQSEPI